MHRHRDGPTGRSWLGVLVVVCALVALSSLPAHADGFLENIGQFDEAVLYRTEVAQTTVYLTSSGLVFDLVEANAGPFADVDVDDVARGRSRPPEDAVRRGCAVRLRFDGAHPSPTVEASAALPGRYHFFRGSDPNAWRTGARKFTDVVYREVWPGIDLVFRIAPGEVTYDVELHPGADPSQVRFAYEGAERVIAETSGVDRIETSVGFLVHQLPVTADRSGRIVCGDANESSHSGLRSFSTSWITFIGEATLDNLWSSSPDEMGRPVVVGATDAEVFPETEGAYQDSSAGSDDVFIAKLSANADSLLWATFLGGTAVDWAFDILHDAAGNVVTTGYTTSADFPTTEGAFASSSAPPADAFVAKLSAAGDSLLWSTCLGGSAHDEAASLVFDPEENVVVTGQTRSSNFPTTAGAYDEDHGGPGTLDVFVTKLAALGDSLVWSTFLGGDVDDSPWRVRLDSQNRPMIVGHTFSSDFPTTVGAFQETYQGGSYDGFLAILSENADSLVASTFLGGNGQDVATGIAVTPAGNLALGVRTSSGNFPTTPGAYDTTPNGAGDFAILELNPTARTLHWSTLVGGIWTEWIANLEIGPGGCLVTAGTTNSPNFPTTADAFDDTYNNWSDGFVAVVDATGTSLLYGSFYGGSDEPPAGWGEGFMWGRSTTVTPDGDVLVAGTTCSEDFPTTEGVWDRTCEGGADGVLVTIELPETNVPSLPLDAANGLQLACSPNPFRNLASIHYYLPHASPVEVGLYDAGGRLVRNLATLDLVPVGAHAVTWDGRNDAGFRVAAGVYFCRLRARHQEVSQQIVLLR